MDHEVMTLKQARELYSWLEDRLNPVEMDAVVTLMTHAANTVITELEVAA